MDIVGISRCGLKLGPTDNDTLVGFLDNMQQHVGILILRGLGPIPLGVRVGRDMKRILVDDPVNMVRKNAPQDGGRRTGRIRRSSPRVLGSMRADYLRLH